MKKNNEPWKGILLKMKLIKLYDTKWSNQKDSKCELKNANNLEKLMKITKKH